MTADEVVAAFATSQLAVAGELPGSRSWRRPGHFGVHTPAPVAGFNGAFPAPGRLAADALASTLHDVARANPRFSLQARPADRTLAAAAADEHGLAAEGEIPLMLLADLPTRVEPPDLGELHRLEPSEVAEHTDLADRVFGVGGALSDLFGPAVLGLPGALAVSIRVDGTAVATGAAHRTGDVVGVSNIVTDPGHRRRGLGAAVTRALCALAAREGARCAYLQASDEAVGLYGSLGFRTVEHWSCWATPD